MLWRCEARWGYVRRGSAGGVRFVAFGLGTLRRVLAGKFRRGLLSWGKFRRVGFRQAGRVMFWLGEARSGMLRHGQAGGVCWGTLRRVLVWCGMVRQARLVLPRQGGVGSVKAW